MKHCAEQVDTKLQTLMQMERNVICQTHNNPNVYCNTYKRKIQVYVQERNTHTLGLDNTKKYIHEDRSRERVRE